MWFSCGATSAVAAKLAVEHCPDAEVCYIDTGSESDDNTRFIADVERWIGRPVLTLKREGYRDTMDVWEKHRFMAGIGGARCTLELKKAVREQYERPGDLQVFGFEEGVNERARADRFAKHQPDVALWCPLQDRGITKDECFLRLQHKLGMKPCPGNSWLAHWIDVALVGRVWVVTEDHGP